MTAAKIMTDREQTAIKRLARVCYQANWDEAFDDLNPAGIEYALAMQVGEAALREMRAISSEILNTGLLSDGSYSQDGQLRDDQQDLPPPSPPVASVTGEGET